MAIQGLRRPILEAILCFLSKIQKRLRTLGQLPNHKQAQKERSEKKTALDRRSEADSSSSNISSHLILGVRIVLFSHVMENGRGDMQHDTRQPPHPKTCCPTSQIKNNSQQLRQDVISVISPITFASWASCSLPRIPTLCTFFDFLTI